jgi:hypothetical protein
MDHGLPWPAPPAGEHPAAETLVGNPKSPAIMTSSSSESSTVACGIAEIAAAESAAAAKAFARATRRRSAATNGDKVLSPTLFLLITALMDPDSGFFGVDVLGVPAAAPEKDEDAADREGVDGD